jgi:hypothetical protein
MMMGGRKRGVVGRGTGCLATGGGFH